MNDPLLTRKQAAEYLQVSEQTLAVWHCTGRYDIPLIKVGRSCRYRKTDLDRWLESRTVGSPTPNELAAAST